MKFATGWHRWATTVATAIVLTGCTASPEGSITLTVATFGDFGYESLFREYERSHPGLRIESRISDFDAHHKQATTALATGRGAADVLAVEEQYLPQFRQSPDRFVDLTTFGATDLKSQWTEWKWTQGVTKDGQVLGLGTDMGSLAICYRRDLYERAGLPADRTAVAALWRDWDAFAAVADRFSAAVPDVKFTDSAGVVYTAMLNQPEESYFAKSDDAFIGATNPEVRKAFQLAGSIGAKGQTAKATTFTQEWTVALKQGQFATTTCPAWMLTLIEQASGPDAAGKWDVTKVPGTGGNWGGSYLTVPAQGKHRREAYDLASWLTAPEQQKRLFLEKGLLPSAPAAYRDNAVTTHTSAYFNSAPVGRTFATSADQVRPNYRGLRDAVVRPVFGRALGRVEEQGQDIGRAWDEAVAEAKSALR